MWIKQKVNDLVKQYGTNDPYEIASAKNIHVIEYNLHEDIYGFCKYIRRNMFIYINSKLNDDDKYFTCSHELGHAILHPRLNSPFLRANTLFSVNKIENEANRFAVELLLPDKTIYEFKDTSLTISEISEMYGVPREVSHLKKI